MSSIFDAIPKTEGRPNHVVDIERFIGAPGSFTFREPKAADLFPRPEVQKALKIAFPEFPDQMLQILMIMRTEEGRGGEEGRSRVAAEREKKKKKTKAWRAE